MEHAAVTFVIMAGGRGERLWPLVRETTPKVALAPDGRKSLLRATIDRLRPVWPGASWLVVTTKAQAKIVQRCLPSSLRRAVMIEPEIKNTAACITLAAVALAIRDPHRIMVVVPADHWVEHAGAFRLAIRTAIHASLRYDNIATIGVRPTHPHTGLGYLCAGARLRDVRGAPVYELAKLLEKPTRQMAQRLLRRPRTYWNSGIFVGTADKFLECVTEWLPDHTRRLVPLASVLSRARPSSSAVTHRASPAYRGLAGVSFDRAVMDHVRGGIVVAGRFGWADLGSWDTWARVGQRSSHAIHVDSHNVTVVSRGPQLVATIGVRDLLVVSTPAATLICRADQSQAVREVVRRLGSDRTLRAYR